MIEITSLDHNGRGIGKIYNKICFVENSLPTEIVEPKIIKEKKNYIEAEVGKYIKKADNRIESPCPYFDKCGGCDLLHINYKDSLNFKQEKIQNICNKYLNKKIKLNKIIECDYNFYYRNKVTFHVKEKIGFYKNKTYDLIPINCCMIGDKLINKSIEKLNKLNLKNINKIVCRTANNKLMIILETKDEKIDIDCLKEIAASIYIKNNDNYKLVYGEKYITEELDNFKFLISPDSFFQINKNICLKLYRKIKEYVKDSSNILDLYCGTGSIGIFVSENKKITGIEINKYAIEDAIKNAKLNNIENIDFICGESGKKLNNIKDNYDTIIVDPPRSGLSSEAIHNLFRLSPQKIIYVSCDPMTLVRDLNDLMKEYNIIEITPFDMFPNTKHIENLVLLKKI